MGDDTKDPIDIDNHQMGSNKRNNAVKEEPPTSPCGSSSSGEIKDDSDGEIGDTTRIIRPETTRNGFVEYRRNEQEREFPINKGRDVQRRHFDPEHDYRHPHLTPEQISLRVRKIPTPDVLAELSDDGLRRLLSDVHELNGEQIRLAKNRRKLLEQMRLMHKEELSSLRECMETLRRLMSERGMNLLATHIGQDVMEFLHEKDQTLDGGNMQLSGNILPSSSESCPGSFGVFPTSQSFAQSTLSSRANFAQERAATFGYQSVGPPASGALIVPPPDFSVPPPFHGPAVQAGNDQSSFDGPGTSSTTANTRDVSATSSASAPALCSPGGESGVQNQIPLRNVPFMSPSERTVEIASGSNAQIPNNGTTEKSGMFGFRPKVGAESDHPLVIPNIPPPPAPILALMRAQRFGMPPFRDAPPVMDSVRGAPFSDERGIPFTDDRGMPFPDERSMPLPNSRIVSLYDDGRLPFHEYEHPQGDEAIRIRHVWSTRPTVNQRRMVQQAAFRDRKVQRIIGSGGTVTGRICPVEMHDRSRSPLGGPKPVAANNNKTGGTTNNYAMNAPSNVNTEENVLSIDENREPGIEKK